MTVQKKQKHPTCQLLQYPPSFLFLYLLLKEDNNISQNMFSTYSMNIQLGLKSESKTLMKILKENKFLI